MALICVLVSCHWAGCSRPEEVPSKTGNRASRSIIALLLISVVVEGILGAQIREMTDELAKFHIDSPRATWIGELEQSWLSLIHQSFSWFVLILTLVAFLLARKMQDGRLYSSQKGVITIVVAQMVLGLVMAQIHVYSSVQVLHVGLAAVLLALIFRWFLLLQGTEKRPLASTNGRFPEILEL